MISFKPLRNYLESKGLSPNALYEKGVISTNIATSINNDRPISFANLEKVCNYLDLKVEEAIVIIKDNSQE